MNTTELIEIARECCFSRQVVGDETVLITFRSQQLQQFAQRIEQPLQHRINELIFDVAHQQRQIAELEKDCDILATNYDAARRASRFAADVADQALADLKAAEKQIEQLQNQITKISEMAFLGLNIQVRKALKELCDTLEQSWLTGATDDD